MKVCVYCGSSSGTAAHFSLAAHALGQGLARAGHSLVYGGGNIGLMGEIANAALQAGGEVIGVITHHLADKELAHHGLSQLIYVDSMQQRKAQMAELADAFIALPGGFGTLEEWFEVLTAAQLGLHTKPLLLLNVADFWSPLWASLQHQSQLGFISAQHLQLPLLIPSVEAALAQLSSSAVQP
jgi:uncharacterized protein (TIGR00730 family)